MATEQLMWKAMGPLRSAEMMGLAKTITVDIEAAEKRIAAFLASAPTSEDLRNAADQLMKATVPVAIPALPPGPTEHVPDTRSSYLSKYLEGESLGYHVSLAVRALRDYQFDAIAFRGMSGALLAPAIALQMKKTLIMVRKSGERNHATSWSYKYHVEGDFAARVYVIVDDLISSGETVRAIKEAVRHFAPHAKCIGTLCVNRLEYQFEKSVYSTGIERIPLETRP